nr:glycosyl hydrolase family 65 protein [uncultured Blautia sp.]
MDINKKPIYPVESWDITETAFRVENNYRNETTFALSNGYIGTRGTFEEAYDFDIDTGLEGNFINGFYESEVIRYGEANFGSPLHSQSLLNLPNAKEIRLYAGNEEFHMQKGRVSDYSRVLRMRDGILERSLLYTTPSGKQMRINIRRFVSFQWKNIMEIRYSVTPLNFSDELTFVTCLEGNVENHTRKTNPIVDYGPFGRRLEPVKTEAEDSSIYYEAVTKNSRLTAACGCLHSLEGAVYKVSAHKEDLRASLTYTVKAEQGKTVCLDKYICYSSDLDMETEELEPFTKRMLKSAAAAGYEQAEKEQIRYMNQYWEKADVVVKGDDALQQGIRFNLFHIMQSAGRDGRTGMGAKGLSGEGYEGHYFWDTEMYVLPVFVYTDPELAAHLLDYRYGTLDQARARARILGHEKGALYPWRTINGEEASTYYPLGTAQYHIIGDIAYALCLYLDVTRDKKYFLEKGAEMLIEMARIWADVGSFAECRGGKYCICDVTGPDEYNVLVDNNFYTNLLARESLRAALKAVRYLKEQEPGTYEGLAGKLDFAWEETELWDKIIENMYFPYDEKRGVYPLDDGFMMRRPWDETRIPPEKRAWLYENYHPLFIMRHRMSKQADAILGMYLYSNLFTEEELKRNYDFYQEVTLHHSSLSTCIFGIVACEIGYYQEAYTYFSQSARMDLDDYHNNFYAGIHAANMAGTWQAVVNGFAGLRTNDGTLRFKPYLPEKWEGYQFCIGYQGSTIKVEIGRRSADFTLLEGKPAVFYVNGKACSIKEEGGTWHEEI